MLRTRTAAGLAAAGALALATAVATPASASTTGDQQGNGTTTVVLNPALVPTLVDTLKVRTVTPGMLSAPGGVAQVSFPITRIKGGVISHVGGLEFTPVGGGDLKITKFDVDTNTGYLTAVTRLNGKKLPSRVKIFALGAVQPVNGAAPACAGVPAGLTLTSDAANALGAPSFAGAFVGDACVVPATDGHGDDD
ncbi:hypothetical protein ACFUC1_18375 [Pedococcus sp. NPDC057267]|uniref:hypothetical protein n=1 Tax=Pedococcus sp. NPDC057267 TaxID=3346077 RepID=UPI00363796DE